MAPDRGSAAPAVNRLQMDLQTEYDMSESGASQFVNGLPIADHDDHQVVFSIVVLIMGEQTQMPVLDGASKDAAYMEVLKSRLQILGMSFGGANQFANGQPVLSPLDRQSLLWIVAAILGVGSATSGSGSGKVTFNAFSITRSIDSASPLFFQQLVSAYRRFGRPKW